MKTYVLLISMLIIFDLLIQIGAFWIRYEVKLFTSDP